MSDRSTVATDAAPQNDRPYSQAVVDGGWCYVSGQGPTNAETGETLEGDIRDQTRQTLDNVKAIVEDAGGSLEDVAKVTVYLDDMDDYDALNEAYGEYFDEEPPARACVEVARLPGDIDVEIEAVARIS
jgi:2-iminobutanoate/2-iminopropanoate deaminase